MVIFLCKLNVKYTDGFKVKQTTTAMLHIVHKLSLPSKFDKELKLIEINNNTGVPDHDGGWPKQINAWFLYTHMVYL